jgi:hypothetical protein
MMYRVAFWGGHQSAPVRHKYMLSPPAFSSPLINEALPGRSTAGVYFLSVFRIRDVYPGSRILIFTHPGTRIPDPKTGTKERGEKKLFLYLLCSHKFHKIVNYFIFDMLKKKFEPIFKEF